MINKSWDAFLNNEFKQEYFQKLSLFLKNEYASKTIYPPKEEVFSAFYFTDLDKVKVVIIGQDPYHQPKQACGMCFAVKPGVELPPSLVNIYREIESNFGIKLERKGYLADWARQGVLLLNSVLTVQRDRPNSHKDKGWEIFTNHVIEKLNSLDQPMVFLLWGRNARDKKALLNNPRHLVLEAAHPSPLSAHNGFFGCGHFSKANAFLKEQGLDEIKWGTAKRRD